MRQERDAYISEIKSLFESEKTELRKTIDKLTKELNLKSEEEENQPKDLTNILDEHIGEVRVYLSNMKKLKSQALRTSLGISNGIRKLGDSVENIEPDRNNDLYNELTQLYKELTALKNVMVLLETNEKKLQEQIYMKDLEIDKLQRIIRAKAENYNNESINNYAKQREMLMEQLLEKDAQINKLKKQLGDLRIEMNLKSLAKPPPHSPSSPRSEFTKHNRSLSLTQRITAELSHLSAYISNKPEETLHNELSNTSASDLNLMRKCQRMVNCSSAMECEFCKKQYPTHMFHDHVLTCKIDGQENLSFLSMGSSSFCIDSCSSKNEIKVLKTKIHEANKRNKDLIMKLSEAKFEKDQLKTEAERLLIQLKEAKLELAISEEKGCEKELDYKKEIKVLVEEFLKLKKHVKDKARAGDIDRALNYSRMLITGQIGKKVRSCGTSPSNRSKMFIFQDEI